MKFNLVLLLAIVSFPLYAQIDTADNRVYENSAQVMLDLPNRLTIGGYGQIEYIQNLDSETMHPGELDVHRMVMLFGYKFSSGTSFITELEFEHVKEVYVEQAFLEHRLNRYMNLRAGLILVPMGFINEYHEPTSFNGVLRPMIDKVIVPSTWREIGAGITGNILPLNINYQLYLMNGFNGYDGAGLLDGNKGFRSGRQKGAEAFMNGPDLSARIQYYGLPSLNIGLSAYTGTTESTLYTGIDRQNNEAIRRADSSVVNSSWLGADLLFNKRGWDLRAQFYFVNIGNSEEYNLFTGSDLGSQMGGFYLEAGYDVLHSTKIKNQKLKPFIRYSSLNTHMQTEGNITNNPLYSRNFITTGLGWWLTSGAVLKADVQFSGNDSENLLDKSLNLGIGVRF